MSPSAGDEYLGTQNRPNLRAPVWASTTHKESSQAAIAISIRPSWSMIRRCRRAEERAGGALGHAAERAGGAEEGAVGGAREERRTVGPPGVERISEREDLADSVAVDVDHER